MNKYSILFLLVGWNTVTFAENTSTATPVTVVQPPVTASSHMPNDVTYDVVNVENKKEYRIRVIGYGAAPQSKDFSMTQRKLMAYRAAQMDAYRLMAEQINGLSIKGQSSFGNSLTQKDSVEGYVSGTLKGIKILSTDFLPDGTARAIAEYSQRLE